ncbi:tryptophan halogenase family protein [Aquisalinus flavus]|uniref:Tryptophan halogenase n=1 Tax=Aquisalinus flavus TaxID=1526572 RepID=A0A8J2V6I1_9PROT|nr:tryptophan halogenase family protein [Aquisalinus flavus]MBD0425765.1 tryptophan 7-halogenase [Aquisalinus flavus]UNE48627.1 tryptophan 7-halogenase [Aquisalinus flavus]GGD13478.1 tryptophan halogenase [Aquisalinus flavus]
MDTPLNIVIVGGGTAGWSAAAAIAGIVSRNVASVRLIESEEIGTVGVGEATLPHMKEFNDHIGVIEADMMQQANATFKLGIEFVDWGFKGSSYIHPFGVHGQPIGGARFHHQWVRATQSGHETNLQDYSYPIVASRAGKFDFPSKDQNQISSTYSYAYHFDAALYAGYLRRFAERRGAVRTEGKVTDVSLDGQSGDIASVTLESGEVVTADLFIDCTGFRALLIGETLGVAYQGWSKWLPCDRAVAVPCDRLPGKLLPYTRSTARAAGWQWRIPLQSRTGNGYVYASDFISDDEAASTLLSNLDGAAQSDPRFLKFRAGRRVASWQKNCVAIGLSSGFLEPLESTSIYLIQQAITTLLTLFPRKTVDPALRAEFNRRVDLEYDRVRDFLILHYYANARDDAELWRYCRSMEVPDSLLEKLEFFRSTGHIETYTAGLFTPASWLAVYVGQGVMPQRYDRQADKQPLEEMLGEIRKLRAQIAERVDRMPSHGVFVEDYCPSNDVPAAIAEAVE